MQTYLPDDLLVKMDIATMAYSVEARSPLLDHQLMEFAASLPVELQARAGPSGKRAAEERAARLCRTRSSTRQKMGFAVPLARWFRGELRDLPADVLLDRRSLDRGYFRRSEIECLIREHRRGSGGPFAATLALAAARDVAP